MGGPNGLSLSQTLVMPDAPSPTGLSFVGVSDGELSFYVSTAGREAALSLAFDLGGEQDSGVGLPSGIVTSGAGASLASILEQATSGSVQSVAQFLTLTGSNLDLAATLLTVSVVPSNLESESGGAGGGQFNRRGPGTGQGRLRRHFGRFGTRPARSRRERRFAAQPGAAIDAGVGARVDRPRARLGRRACVCPQGRESGSPGERSRADASATALGESGHATNRQLFFESPSQLRPQPRSRDGRPDQSDRGLVRLESRLRKRSRRCRARGSGR